MKKIVLSIICSLVIALGGFYFTVVKPALANVVCSLPFTLTNGTIADATQVMANYNALVTCLTNAAAAGANNDITSLSGLTTPITPNQGGSNVYIGAAPTASGADLSIATTTPTGWANTRGYSVIFTAVATNTSVQTLSVNGQTKKNIYKQTSAGPIPLAGGEIVPLQQYFVTYDGTQYQLITTAGLASLTATGQSLSGGANVVANNLGTINGGGGITVNCGLSPLQYFSNNGNLTITAPGSDGSCDLMQTNTGSASLVSFSGFTVGSNTGEPLTSTNTNKFIIHIERINSVSTYVIKALQ